MFKLENYACPVSPYLLTLNVILGRTDTAFSYIAPLLWNSQPDKIRNFIIIFIVIVVKRRWRARVGELTLLMNVFPS